jgi:hypothetical protein
MSSELMFPDIEENTSRYAQIPGSRSSWRPEFSAYYAQVIYYIYKGGAFMLTVLARLTFQKTKNK